jgi:hypothetical protein
MLFRFTCRQCGLPYYPWAGPITPCPYCLAEPEASGFRVFAWFAITALLVVGVVYLTMERYDPFDNGKTDPSHLAEKR